MYLVGLTGGIASGKSTVAQRLVHRGAELIDTDDVAREVVQPDTPTWHKIVEHFGADVIGRDGFIDRARLGAVVFADPDKRALLNTLTHPVIMDEVAERLELYQAFDGVVVVDVPLLVESGMDRGYEAVVVVAASEGVQVERLVRDRGMTEGEARSRIAAQAPLDEKLARATHVIWNDDGLDALLARTDEVADELFALAREKTAREDESVPNH